MPSRLYDLALFDELNERYRATPLVPEPPLKDRRSLAEAAQRRLKQVMQRADPAGKDVLELGAGQGWLTRSLLVEGGARAVTGVDIKEYPDWKDHLELGPDLALVVTDLATQDVLPPESVDLIVSAAVFEHVNRPVAMLRSLHRLLRSDGEAWLYFNLYGGRKASHRYREVYFPWPHLLFRDDVCAAFYERETGRPRSFAWVNRLTIAQYVQICVELGFDVQVVRTDSTPVEDDLEFYLEFEDRLGRYAALDLQIDFATLLLRKVSEPLRPTPRLGYVEAQSALDAAVAGSMNLAPSAIST